MAEYSVRYIKKIKSMVLTEEELLNIFPQISGKLLQIGGITQVYVDCKSDGHVLIQKV